MTAKPADLPPPFRVRALYLRQVGFVLELVLSTEAEAGARIGG